MCKSRATHRVLITCKCHVTCVMQRLGTKWFCISDLGWRRWSGAPSLDSLPAKAEGARSAHRWLIMHRPLTSFSPPAEAACRGVATVIRNSFLGARIESWVLGEDQCSRPSQGMLLSDLQRYYLSLDTPWLMFQCQEFKDKHTNR